MQGRPQLSRRRNGLSLTLFALGMVHHRTDMIGVDVSVLGFAVPHPPVQPFNLRDDRRLNDAPVYVAFRDSDHVGTRDYLAFAAPWLAYALPCRRFAITLTGASARLGPVWIANPSP